MFQAFDLVIGYGFEDLNDFEHTHHIFFRSLCVLIAYIHAFSIVVPSSTVSLLVGFAVYWLVVTNTFGKYAFSMSNFVLIGGTGVDSLQTTLITPTKVVFYLF
jgi:hypothetical protein